MPAYFNEGFSVREPAWHGLATVLDDYPGRQEAMMLAGHDFTVIEEEIFTYQGEGMYPQITGWKALVNNKNKAILNVVRDSYTVIQNDTMWDIIDAIVKEPNIKYETAGILKDGAILWVLVKLDEPVKIKGDNTLILPFAMVATAHDGSSSCHASTIATRVICANTYAAAEIEAKRNGTSFTFKHTKNVGDRIEEARSALGMVRHNFQEFIEFANELANIQIDTWTAKKIIEKIVPMPLIDVLSDRQKENIMTARTDIREILRGGLTVPEEHAKTGYGLYCAATEYLDHVKAHRTPESYFQRTINNTTAKKRVAELIMAD